ncbi:MAG: gliding motility protein GldC [Bacteroidetes bacterium]|nr:gliding motility protein GldC [Bacteroidota bacterium]
MKKTTKTSEIKIKVGLDEKNIPLKMSWKASDGAKDGKEEECKAMLLSLFDVKTKDTLKIDLWTTDMQVMEMDRFFYHTLRSLADTYFRATQNKELANQMQQFAQYFGEKTSILPKE